MRTPAVMALLSFANSRAFKSEGDILQFDIRTLYADC